MKMLIRFAALLLAAWTGWATTFTEFYCDYTSGSNTNSGSSSGAAAKSAVSGNWTNTTATFFKSGLDPAATVNVGDWAAVYADGASVAAFVSRVTARDDTADTITLSTTAFAGANPADIVGTASITVGGAWKGPNGTVGFPFDFILNTATNASGNVPRVNFYDGATYSVTAGMTHSKAGPIRFQGYHAVPGDGYRAVIDGGNPSASITLLSLTGTYSALCDMILANNGTTSGNGYGLSLGGNYAYCRGVTVSNIYNSGFSLANYATMISCEAVACNTKNSASHAGFKVGSSRDHLERCVAHDNVGSNTDGFLINDSATLLNCISESNGRNGFTHVAGFTRLIGCDAYNNGACGFDSTLATVGEFFIENSNFIKNTTYGINSSGSSIRNGEIWKCGFGTGTMANGTADFGSAVTNGVQGGIYVSGTIQYASGVTPWSEPVNGDFRIALAAAKGAGLGAFTTSLTNTLVSYPDIGAAQHYEAPATSVTRSTTWAQ